MEKNLEYWVLVRFQFFDVKGLVLFGFGVLIKITGRFMFSFSLQCMTLLVGRQEGRPAGKKPGVTGTRKQSGLFYWIMDYVGGDDLTGALHVLQLQLSPPPPSSLSAIKSRMETFWYWLTEVYLENGH